jgi:homoserine kinase
LTPATSANLGPGFDSLGLALQLYNRFDVETASIDSDPETPLIEINGALGAGLPTTPDNLFFRAFKLLFDQRGLPVPPVKIRMTIAIPHGSGLGSSATAVVGGLMAANELLSIQNPALALTKDQLLAPAVAAEAGNHPDNVAPALLGGLVATTALNGEISAVKTRFPNALKAVIFTPSFPMDTVAGRKLLPPSYPKADVTFNTGRVALLLTALQTGRYEVIAEAMQDRLHQPYRQALFPAMPEIIEAAVAAGAYGASLSGGGSSLIALASGNFHQIQRAMEEAARSRGIGGFGQILVADQQGARVIAPYKRARKQKSHEIVPSYGSSV